MSIKTTYNRFKKSKLLFFLFCGVSNFFVEAMERETQNTELSKWLEFTAPETYFDNTEGSFYVSNIKHKINASKVTTKTPFILPDQETSTNAMIIINLNPINNLFWHKELIEENKILTNKINKNFDQYLQYAKSLYSSPTNTQEFITGLKQSKQFLLKNPHLEDLLANMLELNMENKFFHGKFTSSDNKELSFTENQEEISQELHKLYKTCFHVPVNELGFKTLLEPIKTDGSENYKNFVQDIGKDSELFQFFIKNTTDSQEEHAPYFIHLFNDLPKHNSSILEKSIMSAGIALYNKSTISPIIRTKIDSLMEYINDHKCCNFESEYSFDKNDLISALNSKPQELAVMFIFILYQSLSGKIELKIGTILEEGIPQSFDLIAFKAFLSTFNEGKEKLLMHRQHKNKFHLDINVKDQASTTIGMLLKRLIDGKLTIENIDDKKNIVDFKWEQSTENEKNTKLRCIPNIASTTLELKLKKNGNSYASNFDFKQNSISNEIEYKIFKEGVGQYVNVKTSMLEVIKLIANMFDAQAMKEIDKSKTETFRNELSSRLQSIFGKATRIENVVPSLEEITSLSIELATGKDVDLEKNPIDNPSEYNKTIFGIGKCCPNLTFLKITNVTNRNLGDIRSFLEEHKNQDGEDKLVNIVLNFNDYITQTEQLQKLIKIIVARKLVNTHISISAPASNEKQIDMIYNALNNQIMHQDINNMDLLINEDKDPLKHRVTLSLYSEKSINNTYIDAEKRQLPLISNQKHILYEKESNGRSITTNVLLNNYK